MTADRVVDASAVAAVVFVEAEAAAINARIAGCLLHAPTLLRFEMANIAIKKIRKAPLERDLILLQHQTALAIAIIEHEIDQQQTLDLAERMKLTAYDASYLWLSRHLDCELITLDDELDAAARAT